MQVTCLGFDWTEVGKRTDAETVVREMIETDDIDLYATYLPDELWPGDSAMLHFAVADALEQVASSAGEAARFPGVEAAARLISTGASIDELGLSPLTEGTCFVSLSPGRVAELHDAFVSLPLEALAERCAPLADWPAEAIAGWLVQWRDALGFVRELGLGLLGHCG